MGLFKTLVDNSDPVKKSEIPTFVQMFSTSPLVGSIPSYAPVHYTAMQTDAAPDETTMSLGARHGKQHQVIFEPDLGVWSVRCDGNMVDALLPKDVGVFVWTVDLTCTPFHQVEPEINAQQQALIRFLIQHPRTQECGNPTEITSLELLQTAQFGLAPDDKSMPKSTATQAQDASKNCVSLQICVRLPSDPSNDDLQKVSLLNYHFRKFCATLQASLVFVSEEEKKETLATISINDLPSIWKALATGQQVWKYASLDDIREDKETEDGEFLLYGPNTQTDLIETVWLRHASAPGYWDAKTDSVWKVFPPVSTLKSSDESKIPAGDESWLAELRASMASVTTTAATPVKESKSASTSATPNDKAVSSFFEGLLK